MEHLRNLLFKFIYLYIVITALLPYNFKISKVPELLTNNLILLIIFLIYAIIIIKDKNKFIMNIKDYLHDVMGIGLTLFLIVMLISISYATYKTIAISESLRFASFLFLYFIIKYESNTKKYVQGLIYSYILTLILVNILGIYQAFTGFGSDKKYIIGLVDRTSITFGNPNSFAAFLILGVFPIIMLMLYEKKLVIKIMYAFLLLIFMINIYYTQSRNAWIALTLGCIVLSIVYSWKLLVCFLPLGFLIKYVPQISSRVKDITNHSMNQIRINLWKIALKMIKDHPVRGVGNGNYFKLYGKYVKKYPELAYSLFTEFPSHNSYLKIESELGIFGGLSFMIIIVMSIYRFYMVMRSTKQNFNKAFFIGFLSSTIAFLFMNLSDNLFFLPKVVTYFWIFLALADAILFQNKCNNKEIS